MMVEDSSRSPNPRWNGAGAKPKMALPIVSSRLAKILGLPLRFQKNR